MKKKLVVLSGAGISAESGIKTFRDADGLWENHDVMEVASIDGWRKNPQLVLEFYNQRRAQLKDVQPNRAHIALAELEKFFDVDIVTQNVDDLHERAGSGNVLHLHGELTKARSVDDESLIVDIGYDDLKWGRTGPDGAQLRPHIVWFGEPVPLIEDAARLVMQADILAVVGTSLNVYPAAGLVSGLKDGGIGFLVDPGEVAMNPRLNFTVIREPASRGVDIMCDMLKKAKE